MLGRLQVAARVLGASETTAGMSLAVILVLAICQDVQAKVGEMGLVTTSILCYGGLGELGMRYRYGHKYND
jgi:hypothetical protein